MTQTQLGTSNNPHGNVRKRLSQPIEAINHPGAHLRIDVVLSLSGMSRSQWYRLMSERTAPQPLRFGRRCTRWLASDVAKFLAERTAQGVR